MVSASNRPAILTSSERVLGMDTDIGSFLQDRVSRDGQLDRRRGLQVVAEPSLVGGFALANILGPAIHLHHRNVVPGHDHATGPAPPEAPGSSSALAWRYCWVKAMLAY